MINIKGLLGQLILVHLLLWNMHGTVVILFSGRVETIRQSVDCLCGDGTDMRISSARTIIGKPAKLPSACVLSVPKHLAIHFLASISLPNDTPPSS